MFGKLKDKLKSALSIFSKKAEEEAEVKVVETISEVIPEVKPKEVIRKEEEKVEEKKTEKKKEKSTKIPEKKEIVEKRPETKKVEEKKVIPERIKEEKETVLILHGWEDNAKSGFIPQLKDFLDQKNIKALAFDQPSTAKPIFEEWFSFAEQKIKENKAASLSLVGHSMGGLLALKLAEKYKLKRLILVAPVGSSPSENYFKEIGYQCFL